MDLIFITNDPDRAVIAQKAGVNRIMVDLEINGKVARQGHLDTVISRHSLEDLASIHDVMQNGHQLIARINPLFDGSGMEIDQCVRAGADIIMLPMFTCRDEVARFIQLLQGRAKASLLLETPQAFVRSSDIFSCPGVDEVHIGLNDLHLGMGLSFMFELLSHGVVEQISNQLNQSGIKHGFGGIARLGRGALDAGLILSEHVRLHSSQVILSRDFHQVFETARSECLEQLRSEIFAIEQRLVELRKAPEIELQANYTEVKKAVAAVVAQTN